MICRCWLGSAECCEPGGIENSVKYLTPHASHASLGTPGVVVHKQTESLQCIACSLGASAFQSQLKSGDRITFSSTTLNCMGWALQSGRMGSQKPQDSAEVTALSLSRQWTASTSIYGAWHSVGLLWPRTVCVHIRQFLFLGISALKLSLPSRIRWKWKIETILAMQNQ